MFIQNTGHERRPEKTYYGEGFDAQYLNGSHNFEYCTFISNLLDTT